MSKLLEATHIAEDILQRSAHEYLVATLFPEQTNHSALLSGKCTQGDRQARITAEINTTGDTRPHHEESS